MMDHERPDARTDAGLPHPGDDPRVAATLAVVVSRLTEPPDELTTRRHLAAITAAMHDPAHGRATDPVAVVGPDDADRKTAPMSGSASLGWKLVRRSTIAAAAAVAALVMLAGGGLLPDPAQQAVAEAAHWLGVSLPAPATTGDHDGVAGQPRAGDPTDADVAHHADADSAAGGTSDAAAATEHEAADDPGVVDQPVDEPPVAAADGAAGRGRPANPGADTPRTHPLWDIHPSERTPPSRGAAPQRPAEPGPPAVDPPARVPTPAPGGRDPGPPAGQGKAPAASTGPGTPRSDKAAAQAQQAPRAVPAPAQGQRR